MKHAFIFIQRLFIFASLLVAFGAYAQTPNITAQLVISPNPSPYLSDWQSHREMVMFTAMLTQPMNQPVKLMAQVSLNGQIVARTKPEKMPMLTLHQGQNLFYADRIIPFDAVSFTGNIDGISQRLGRLPEGNYDICVWFIDAERGTPIGASSCATFSIRDVNPPTLITPADGAQMKVSSNGTETTKNKTITNAQPVTLAQLAAMDTKSLSDLKAFTLVSGNDKYMYTLAPKSAQESQNLSCVQYRESDYNFYYRYEMKDAMVSSYSKVKGHVDELEIDSYSLNFSWLPPMPVPNTPVQYKLRIARVLAGQSAVGALTTATPIIEKSVNTPFYAVTYLSDEYFKLGETGVHGSLGGVQTPLGKDALLLEATNDDFFVRQHYIDFLSRTAETFTYAWSVQAQDAKGNPIGKNNGWSEARLFDVVRQPKIQEPGGRRQNSLLDIYCDDAPTPKIDSPKTVGGTTTTTNEKKPCGYTFKEKKQKIFGPWKLFKSHSQYANTYKRTIYRVYRIFTCSLWEGHGGPHHGTAVNVYVKEGEEKTTQADKPADGPTTGIEPPQYLPDDPAKKDQRDSSAVDSIPTREEADKAEKEAGAKTVPIEIVGLDLKSSSASNTNIALNGGRCPYTFKKLIRKFFTTCKDGYKTLYYEYEVFQCLMPKGHSGPHEGTSKTVYVSYGSVSCNNDDGGNIPTAPEPPKDKVVKPEDLAKVPTEEEAGKPPAVVVVVKPVPCPFVEKKLLRTVVGPWKKVSTTVRHIAWRKTVVAWVDVVWARDIFNVFSVSHCTLLKGHGGAHKMGPAVEEKEKYGTITEKVTYGPGEAQVPPHPHSTDSLPEE